MQPKDNVNNNCYDVTIHKSKVNDMKFQDKYHSQCECYGILFPYHCYKMSKPDHFQTIFEHFLTTGTKFRLFRNFSVFPKVYAADTQNTSNNSPIPVVNTSGHEEQSNSLQSTTIEALARAYIAKESGRERVLAIFKKNHKGENSPEMFGLSLVLIQTFAISYLLKYVPAYKLAKEDFITDYNATAFRTHIEAVRKMSDHASLRGILEAIPFASKITMFAGGFLFISQSVASYRNKTSVLEYSLAAGITGGVARIHMGPKGFVAGSVLGTVLGTMFGCVTYVLLHSLGMSEDSRHLKDIISRLEVERSIVGDSVFKQRLKELAEQENQEHSVS